MISMGSLTRRTPAGWQGPLPTGTDLNVRTDEPFGFRDYARGAREPGVNLMLARPSRTGWQISRHPLRRVILQSGATGGATIADGAPLSRWFTFFLRKPGYAHPMTLNGEAVTIDDIAVLPPDQPFALVCRGPHKWISLSVPREALEQAGFSRRALQALGAAASVIRVPPAAATQLGAVVTDAMDFIRSVPICRDTDHFCDIERDLLAELFSAITRDACANATIHPRGHSLDRIVRRALACLRTQEGPDPHVEYICRAIDVAERSLLRAFHKFFGIGPTQYLKLRRLNDVHHALQASACAETTVTGVLTNHGVTELGRFAGEYKALFGESPSQTLRPKGEATRQAIPPAGRHP